MVSLVIPLHLRIEKGRVDALLSPLVQAQLVRIQVKGTTESKTVNDNDCKAMCCVVVVVVTVGTRK